MFKYQSSWVMAVLLTWTSVAIPSIYQAHSTNTLLLEATLHLLLLAMCLLLINESKLYNFNIRVLFFIVSIALIIALMLNTQTYLYLIYSVMLTSIMAFYFPFSLCLMYICAIHICYLFIHNIVGQAGWSFVNAGTFIAFHFFALIVTQKMLSERKAREELATSNAQLEAAHMLLRMAAAQDERLKLARELHDDVGHILTSLIINLDVSRRTIEAHNQPSINHCYEQAKHALETTRQVVSDKLNAAPLNLSDALNQLIDHTPRIKVSLNAPAQLSCPNLTVANCILRCCQEAITNSLKHSKATEISINIERYEHTYHLNIHDNGIGCDNITLGSGLKGMHERVEDIGGTCQIAPSNNGFKIIIRVPYEQN